MKKALIALLIFSAFYALSEDKKSQRAIRGEGIAEKQKQRERLAEALHDKEITATALDAINEGITEEQTQKERLAETLHVKGFEAITLGSAALVTNLIFEMAYSAGNPILTTSGAALAGFGCWLVFQNRPEAREIRKRKIKENIVKSLNDSRK